MMTKEQREQAEDWADIMEEPVKGGYAASQPDREIAALLRAGIAASEECEQAWLAAWDAEWRAQDVTAGWQRCARALRNMNEKLMEEA